MKRIGSQYLLGSAGIHPSFLCQFLRLSVQHAYSLIAVLQSTYIFKVFIEF